MKTTLVLGTSTGGVGQHVRSLAAGLVAAGDEVLVAGPAATQEQFGFRATGARFAPVEVSSAPRPVADLRSVRRLRAVLAAERPDVVHAHGLRAGALAVLAGARPLVVTWHNAVLGSGPQRLVLAGLERLVARGADLTLGASSDLVERARALGARDARLAPVAAPPLPAPRRDAAAVRAGLGLGDRPLVLAVGRVAPQKAYDVLLAAAATWAARDPTPLVAVAGEGPDRGAWQARADAAGAPVRFLGHRDDVADLLAAADVAVLTSAWEARALVAQEALRAGTPLVATAVGGVPDLVGDAAVLVPWGPRDEVARGVAAGVVRLLDDPAERERLAAAGRERAAGWPDGAAVLRQLRGAYRGLAGG
ncbi:glycosyltransferase family 4 protein [Vallicoccus soli]|uniref:Glycosyltransferase n=1 Tax=Vallicoccus soli TaxID=2339232 RepID=A0A3A3YVN4_9ACTN|nr:glycosyltransferase family 4 protein [Vallicoccus soli]RJK93118.1 glycosyltransferase [Vallicoccus soli]